MRLNTKESFNRFLILKANNGWCTDEVVEIFKARYGENYDKALANFLMDSLAFAPKIRAQKYDKDYATEWDNILSMSKGE